MMSGRPPTSQFCYFTLESYVPCRDLKTADDLDRKRLFLENISRKNSSKAKCKSNSGTHHACGHSLADNWIGAPSNSGSSQRW